MIRGIIILSCMFSICKGQAVDSSSYLINFYNNNYVFAESNFLSSEYDMITNREYVIEYKLYKIVLPDCPKTSIFEEVLFDPLYQFFMNYRDSRVLSTYPHYYPASDPYDLNDTGQGKIINNESKSDEN